MPIPSNPIFGHGSDAAVALDARDMTHLLHEVDSSEEIDQAETTNFRPRGKRKTNAPGLSGGSTSLTGRLVGELDFVRADLAQSLGARFKAHLLTILPFGPEPGSLAVSRECNESSYSAKSGLSEIVSTSAALGHSRVTGDGLVLHGHLGSNTVARNQIVALSATEVTTDGQFRVTVEGRAAETVTIARSDNAAQAKIKLEALTAVDGVSTAGAGFGLTGQRNEITGVTHNANVVLVARNGGAAQTLVPGDTGAQIATKMGLNDNKPAADYAVAGTSQAASGGAAAGTTNRLLNAPVITSPGVTNALQAVDGSDSTSASHTNGAQADADFALFDVVTPRAWFDFELLVGGPGGLTVKIWGTNNADGSGGSLLYSGAAPTIGTRYRVASLVNNIAFRYLKVSWGFNLTEIRAYDNVAAGNVSVSGAGTAIANGEYPPGGVTNGGPHFYKTAVAGQPNVSIYFFSGFWHIEDTTNEDLLYRAPGTAASVPTTGWVSGGTFGVAPNPTVTRPGAGTQANLDIQITIAGTQANTNIPALQTTTAGAVITTVQEGSAGSHNGSLAVAFTNPASTRVLVEALTAGWSVGEVQRGGVTSDVNSLTSPGQSVWVDLGANRPNGVRLVCHVPLARNTVSGGAAPQLSLVVEHAEGDANGPTQAATTLRALTTIDAETSFVLDVSTPAKRWVRVRWTLSGSSPEFAFLLCASPL